MVEGARGAGKSHLVDNFFAQNTNLDIVYYKFALSDYIRSLKIEDQETGPGVHYFSISNILTILGIANTFLRDKHVVFDRSIFSAYVWSIYRRRMNEDRLMEEFESILSSAVFRNCKLIHVSRPEDFKGMERIKDDIFDKFEDYKTEAAIYDRILNRFNKYIIDRSKSNEAYSIINTFDKAGEDRFNDLLYQIVNNSVI